MRHPRGPRLDQHGPAGRQESRTGDPQLWFEEFCFISASKPRGTPPALRATVTVSSSLRGAGRVGSMGPASPRLEAPLTGLTRSQQDTDGPDLPPACLTSPLAFQIHLFTHSVHSAYAHLTPGTGDTAAKTEALLEQGSQPAGRGDRRRRKYTDE